MTTQIEEQLKFFSAGELLDGKVPDDDHLPDLDPEEQKRRRDRFDDAVSSCAVVEQGNPLFQLPKLDMRNPSAVVGVRTFPHTSGGERSEPKPLATHENLFYMLDRYGIGLSYDVIKKEVVVNVPGVNTSKDNEENAYFSMVESLCYRNQLPATCKNYMTLLADQNQSNPVLEWIQSKPWDGQDRIGQLVDSVHVPANQERAKAIYIYKWLLQCVGVLHNKGSLKAENVLVFSGAQGKGKTTWFNNLLPEDLSEYRTDGVMLQPGDKDSVMSAVSHWLVELGELDATFSKSEIGQLKAFLSKRSDKFRRPYDRKDSNFSRRTSFFASVNDMDFLVDKTGNRRFMALEVLELDWLTDLDTQQLWSQALHCLNEAGGPESMPWELQGDERTMQAEQNDRFTKSDPIEEKVLWLVDKFQDEEPTVRMTATQIAESIGYTNPNKSIVSRIGVVMVEQGFERKKSNNVRFFLVPRFTLDSYQKE